MGYTFVENLASQPAWAHTKGFSLLWNDARWLCRLYSCKDETARITDSNQ